MLFGIIVTAILLVIPFWYLLPRAGIAAPFALVAMIPVGALILLWVMAFKRWPNDDVAERF